MFRIFSFEALSRNAFRASCRSYVRFRWSLGFAAHPSGATEGRAKEGRATEGRATEGRAPHPSRAKEGRAHPSGAKEGRVWLPWSRSWFISEPSQIGHTW